MSRNRYTLPPLPPTCEKHPGRPHPEGAVVLRSEVAPPVTNVQPAADFVSPTELRIDVRGTWQREHPR